ncbi:hypothetical protein NEMIN01_0242 [Nematocida minor]|uniref:uncharacterized protein n=1 Tax=Nematocida minor TaxID=1912983 RepID=UPI00221FA853|nr:uncharacterized protein NEMIN01_0242 [Nematocida minor]KAI5188978.1 hypothetical protein NEMIN01_0242 [Nematocida minor]
MRKKLSEEEEWLLFSDANGKMFLQLIREAFIEDAPGPSLVSQLHSLRPIIFERVRCLYKRAVGILEEGALLLLLIALRERECAEREILLCKNIEQMGKDEPSFVYECILEERKKLPSEGWVYYAVKDIAGNRAKEAKRASKLLRSALWEDIKEFGPFWNSMFGYEFTPAL